MFKQCHHLLRQVDAFLSGREKYLSIGSQHAAQEELAAVPEDVRKLVAPCGPDAALHCDWELAGVAKAAHAALTLVRAMTTLSQADLARCREEFQAGVEDCERWVMRAQSEAYTAAGPTILPLINLAFRGREGHDEISVRCHLYSALDQCEVALEGPFHSAAERAAWENLTAVVRHILKGEKPQPLTPLVEACRAIELALAETAQWTPWSSLNRLISAAAATVYRMQDAVSYSVESHLLHTELDANQDSTLTEARRAAGDSHQALITRLEACFGAVQGLVSDLDAAVVAGTDRRVSACARRLRWTLTDLAVCQADLEALPVEGEYVACVQCQEHNPLQRTICQRCSAILLRPDLSAGDTMVSLLEQDGQVVPPMGPILTTFTEPIVQAVESYREGLVTDEALQAILLRLQAKLDRTSEQAAEKTDDLDRDRFEHGIEHLYMALGQWGAMLENGTAGAAEAGLEYFYLGVQSLVESQLGPDTTLDMAPDYGLVA